MGISSVPELGLASAVSSLSSTAATAFNISTGASTKINNAGFYPWIQQGSEVNSTFWPNISIDPQRWNQLYPYRLLVIDVSNGNSVVGATSTGANIQATGLDQGGYLLSFAPLSGQWECSLPITPQQLSIADQFAINTSATLRGVLEEHNGIKFKMINASGTMGVWPYRASVTNPPQSPGILQSVLGGTLTAVNSLITQVGSVVNTFTTGSPNAKPTTLNPNSAGAPGGPASSGYYMALYLQQFLEQYAEAKKNPANAGWRLVFDIPKQNQSYIVTPMQFTWQQSVNKPMEIMYNLQFKGWRRINLKLASVATAPNAMTITPGILQNILNTITEATIAASDAIGVINAVTSDVNGVFNIISATSLFVKTLAGVGIAASDMPTAISQDFGSAIGQYVAANSSSLSSALSSALALGAIATISAFHQSNGGISQSSVASGQLGASASSAQAANPINQIFNNPNANAELLGQVPVSGLSLNSAQQAKLNQILSNTSLTIPQIQNNITTITNLLIQLENYYGVGNAYYDEVYNLPPPTVRIQPITLSEYALLDSLYEFLQSCYILTATTQVTDLAIVSGLEYVAGLANTSGITFDIPNSKILVPVPYNTTIEAIAARYLGDPNRWVEIATLNNLQEPYLDYTGFQLPLLSNAIGRQVIVSSDTDLYVGQSVTLNGNGQIGVSRNISGISPLPNGNGYLLTLDGLPNLGNFTLANSAYVQAYLPNTTNSQQKILIPSDLPPPQYPGQVNIIPPSIAASDPLTAISSVDWLVNPETGDLIVDSTGNFNLSYGMTNIIQALWYMFDTIRGSLITDLNFGLGVAPGTSIADLNLQNLYNDINTQIAQDPRFTGVNSLQIQANPPTITISLNVGIQGVQGNLPVAFIVGN